MPTLTRGPRLYADNLTPGNVVLIPTAQTHGGSKLLVDDVQPGPYLNTVTVTGRRVGYLVTAEGDGVAIDVNVTVAETTVEAILTTTVRRSTWRITDTSAQEK